MSDNTKTAQEKNAVTMTDGRVVYFSTNQRVSKSHHIDPATNKIKICLDFCNGITRSVDVNPMLMLRAAAFGYEHRLSSVLPRAESIEDAIELVDDVINLLNAGVWSVMVPGGNDANRASPLALALAELTNRPLIDVKKKLRGMTQREKMALRQVRNVADAIIAREQKSRRRAGVDEATAQGERLLHSLFADTDANK